MDAGKIGKEAIHELFGSRRGASRSNVLQGPAFGVDTAIIDMGNGKGLVMASDPLSYIPAMGMKASAWLSVILTANDVSTSGFLPEYAQFVMNLPIGMTDQDLADYWHHIHSFCKEMGIAITGGHTGFDDIGASTLAGGVTMFSIVDIDRVKSSASAKSGDVLILTKTAALSSAAILAMSFPGHVADQLGTDAQTKLASTFFDISTVKEVEALQTVPQLMDGVSAMHDVTEGGVLGAVFELAEAANCGVRVDVQKIIVGEEQRRLCELFRINPLRSVGAGAMLIACAEDVSDRIIQLLKNKNISASVIGRLMDEDEGRKIDDGVRESDLVYTDKDPYWDAFHNAIKKGLK